MRAIFEAIFNFIMSPQYCLSQLLNLLNENAENPSFDFSIINVDRQKAVS